MISGSHSTLASLKGLALRCAKSGFITPLRGGAWLEPEHNIEIARFHGFPALKVGSSVVLIVVERLPYGAIDDDAVGTRGYAVLCATRSCRGDEIAAALGLPDSTYTVTAVLIDDQEAVGVAVGLASEKSSWLAPPSQFRASHGKLRAPVSADVYGELGMEQTEMLPTDDQLEAVADWVRPRLGISIRFKHRDLCLGEFAGRPAVLLHDRALFALRRCGRNSARAGAVGAHQESTETVIVCVKVAGDPTETALVIAFPRLPIARFTPVAEYRDWFSALLAEIKGQRT
jgi:hypothetical protein